MRTIGTLLYLGAAGIVAATLLSLAARVWWGFELLTHFRLQLFAAALAVGAALLLWSRRPLPPEPSGARSTHRFGWMLLAALAIAAGINAGSLAPYSAARASVAAPPADAPDASPAAFGSSAALTVLAVNVRWSNDTYARLLDIVEHENPDAVVVVELTPAWREGLAALDAHYPYRRLAPRSDAFGIGLWSRHPLASSREAALESVAAIDARIETPAGPVRLIGVHLRAPMTAAMAAERNRQYGDLTGLVGAGRAAEPLVVVGDFNTTRYSPVFSDWLKASRLRDVHAGLDITWPTYLPFFGIPIDHCVVNAKIEAASFRRLPAFGSDHYPILCRVTTGSGS